MNVNDVSERSVTLNGDMLKAIFEKQGSLMVKYHDIEARLRLTTDCPVNLHDAKGQLLLKDFAWRTTEELAEAFDALAEVIEDSIDAGPGERYETEDNEKMTHVREEVADALHFLVEMGILSGISADDLVTDDLTAPNGDYLDYLFTKVDTRRVKAINPMIAWAEFQVALGMTCHTLKNKPWKQSQMMTDLNEYKSRYIKAFEKFIALCLNLGFNSEQLYSLYFRKNEVNKFRQRSNY